MYGRWTHRVFEHRLPEFGVDGKGAVIAGIRTGRKESPRFAFLVRKEEERKLTCI